MNRTVFKAVLFCGSLRPASNGQTYFPVLATNKRDALKAAKALALSLSFKYPTIELFAIDQFGHETQIGNYSHYTSVRNVTAWFDQDSDYPERLEAC